MLALLLQLTHLLLQPLKLHLLLVGHLPARLVAVVRPFALRLLLLLAAVVLLLALELLVVTILRVVARKVLNVALAMEDQ